TTLPDAGLDPADRAFVGVLNVASQGVRHHLLDHVALERTAAAEENLLESLDAFEPFAGGHHRDGVERFPALAVAPGAHGIIVFQREAERVDALVAGRARRLRRVDRHQLAERPG